LIEQHRAHDPGRRTGRACEKRLEAFAEGRNDQRIGRRNR